MKVPLDSKYDTCFEGEDKKRRFELLTTLDEIENKYGKKISAVVDLTNTDRFYDKTLISRRGITHIKISIVGHSVLPSAGDVTAFINNVSTVMEDRPDDVIIVHCTHGYNRTGYMICSYLCEKLKYSPTKAIDDFRLYRFPGIYKACYLDALHLLFTPEAFNSTNNDILPTIDYPEERAADDESRSEAIILPDGSVSKSNIDTMMEHLQFVQADTEPRWLVVTPPESGEQGKRLHGEP